MLVYAATVHFLEQEAFLRFSSFIGDGQDSRFADVVLTSKGLAALSKTPTTLTASKGGMTAGELLTDLGSDMLKKGAWEGIVAVVRTMLGG
jgi:hypothetical protein